MNPSANWQRYRDSSYAHAARKLECAPGELHALAHGARHFAREGRLRIARAIVDEVERELLRVGAELDRDALRAGVAHRVRDRFPDQMLRIQVEAARDHHIGRLRGEFAEDVPLFRQALAQRTQVLGKLAQADLGSASESGDEGPELALFLQHQLLEVIEFGFQVVSRRKVALQRFEPERRTREELHYAVVQVARQSQPGLRLCAFLDCNHEGVALHVPGYLRGDFGPQSDMVRGQVLQLLQEQLAFACGGADRHRDALAQLQAMGRIWTKDLPGGRGLQVP